MRDARPPPLTSALDESEVLRQTSPHTQRVAIELSDHRLYFEVTFKDEEEAFSPSFSFAARLKPGSHGLDGVEDQVEDYLLQFDPVSLDRRQVLDKFGLHKDAVLHRFTTGEFDHFSDCCINLHVLLQGRRPLDESANPTEHRAGPGPVPDNAVERLPDFVQVRPRRSEAMLQTEEQRSCYAKS